MDYSKGQRYRALSDSEVNLLDDTKIVYHSVTNQEDEGEVIIKGTTNLTTEELKYKNGLFGASCNVINTIIGSGIIGIPYAIHLCGIGLGTILLLFMGIVTDYSLLLLIKSGDICGDHTFPGVVKCAFGKVGFILVCLSQALNPFLAMVSYNIVLGDTITEVIVWLVGEQLRESFFGSRYFYILLGNLLVMFPVSLHRNVAYLAKFAALSIFMILFFTGFMVYKAFTFGDKVERTENDWQFAHLEFLQGLGIMGHAFICHPNAFLVYDSMKSSTYESWKKVVHISLAIAVGMLMLVGFSGFITYKSFTQGDILNNFCYDDAAANIVRLLFTVNVMLTYPLMNFVVRDVLENSFFLNYQPQPIWRHVTETIAIVIATGAIAVSTNCVAIVLAINGVITSTPLIFFYPAMCFIKLRQEKILSKKNIIPGTIILIGILIFVVGIYQIIYDISKGINCSESYNLPYCLSFTNATTIGTVDL